MKFEDVKIKPGDKLVQKIVVSTGPIHVFWGKLDEVNDILEKKFEALLLENKLQADKLKKLDRHLLVIEAADPRPDLSCHKHLVGFDIIKERAARARALIASDSVEDREDD